MKATLPGWWSKGAVWLWTAAIAMVLGSFWLVVVRAPVESVMGPVQKIVYIHVPSAIMAMSSASVPEATVMQCFEPVCASSRSSSSRTSGPMMN